MFILRHLHDSEVATAFTLCEITPVLKIEPLRGLPSITYGPMGRGGGIKPPVHFYCVLHAKRGVGEGVQIACEISYVLYGKPLRLSNGELKVTFPDCKGHVKVTFTKS